MIIGIGSDIVSIARINRLLEHKKQPFLNKIFTKHEITLLDNMHPNKMVGYVANRFAAKEALAKALGTGIGKHLSFKDISIVKTSQGKPYFEYQDKLKNFIEQTHDSNFNIQLSMSNEKEYAQAFVVIQKVNS
jgi:holo-[acyl-carrier protein] synthase